MAIKASPECTFQTFQENAFWSAENATDDISVLMLHQHLVHRFSRHFPLIPVPAQVLDP